MKAYFQQLFAYDRWANERVLNLIEQTKTQNARVHELFSHLISASFIWQDRCTGRPDVMPLFMARSVDEMKHDLTKVLDGWDDFIRDQSDDSFGRVIEYRNKQGKPFADPLNVVLTQVTNHGTYHRGQIIQLVKGEGFDVPPTDFILYIRQMANR